MLPPEWKKGNFTSTPKVGLEPVTWISRASQSSAAHLKSAESEGPQAVSPSPGARPEEHYDWRTPGSLGLLSRKRPLNGAQAATGYICQKVLAHSSRMNVICVPRPLFTGHHTGPVQTTRGGGRQRLWDEVVRREGGGEDRHLTLQLPQQDSPSTPPALSPSTHLPPCSFTCSKIPRNPSLTPAYAWP